MNTKSIRRFLFAAAVVAILLLAFGQVNKPSAPVNGDNVFTLRAPPFAGIVSAETHPTAVDIGTRLDYEAGISAYYQTPDIIDLDLVRGQFRTIETETEDYIIGSVPVAGYYESADPHVYVHRDGWILAYYKRADPVSKMIDSKAHSITTSHLNNVVATVAAAAGAPFTTVTYYHFGYPNATYMILVAEDKYNGNDFTIELPSTYGYFERSWALDFYSWGSTYFKLDGVHLSCTGSDAYCNCYGSIAAAQLLPDVTHRVALYDWGVLVILYRVP